ncbi:MAG: polysaccharide deacetylase family protein [Desulfobacterales bacterium]|nr:polysaccharide deacetylase family protein [Desulfobacterales bacterium]
MRQGFKGLLKSPWMLILLAVLTAVATASAAPPESLTGEREDFLIIRTTPQDSFASLAARYYGDARHGWWIAQFNGVETVLPDQTLVIPLQPMGRGGLYPNGYQVVPILAYEWTASRPEGSQTVSAAAFEAQMQFLQNMGYHPVSLDHLLDFMDFKVPLPRQAVVITFDGAGQEILDIAAPILRRFHFPAGLFVDTDSVGRKHALTWERIKALRLQGIEVHSFTKTGRDLTQPASSESFADFLKALEAELLISKKTIEKKTGQKCRFLAYPHGRTSDMVIAFLKKHGYRAGFTRKSGSNPFFVGSFRIQRALITGSTTLNEFKQHLTVFAESKLE